MHQEEKPMTSRPMLRAGWYAAVTVKQGVFLDRCYIRHIRAVTEQGANDDD
jgi:hypothetical protein